MNIVYVVAEVLKDDSVPVGIVRIFKDYDEAIKVRDSWDSFINNSRIFADSAGNLEVIVQPWMVY